MFLNDDCEDLKKKNNDFKSQTEFVEFYFTNKENN